jgi:pyruvate/2-oxoglutarate dehydrogenase complex dihydrolipoamide acyltransferase (E2) component
MSKLMHLPKLTEAETETCVAEWLVGLGDKVQEGVPVLTVETEKAVVEVESTVAGVVRRQLVEIGEFVEPGQLIMEVE